ncbi:protein SRG1 [Citrus sinensis]|nr:protein SRG1 [Citrus sinensis]
METKATVIGSSLVEPSILELANNQPLITVPPRYVCPEIDHPLIRNDDSSTRQLPVIDMHRLLPGDNSELEKLDHACKDWGFFQLMNHGVSSSLVEKVKARFKTSLIFQLMRKRNFGSSQGILRDLGSFLLRLKSRSLIGDTALLCSLSQPI